MFLISIQVSEALHDITSFVQIFYSSFASRYPLVGSHIQTRHPLRNDLHPYPPSADSPKCQPFEQPRKLVTQEQQLVTADSTLIFVLLMVTVGSFLPSVKNALTNASLLVGQLSQLHKDVPDNCKREQDINLEKT
ncbi:unnamed protein product [Vicia faba]|uniref:Uncharacterized protein n=1 Tax=Vicia faba TaxID=3906 RepID=A0AAV0Z5G1_VICFA|nr:unnamed protein product [Vicia faba]